LLVSVGGLKNPISSHLGKWDPLWL
jgi:hypothetical protein